MSRRRHAPRWVVAAVLVALSSLAHGAEGLDTTFNPPPSWPLPTGWAWSADGLTATVKSAHARLVVPGTAGLGDCAATVIVRRTAGLSKELRYGLLIRAADGDNGFFVLLRGDGAYWLGKLIGGKLLPTLTGYVGVIDDQGPNALSVVCQSDRQTVTVNGNRLVSRSDGSYARGSVGLWVEGTGAARYERLIVGDPSRVPTRPAPPAQPAQPVQPTPPTHPTQPTPPVQPPPAGRTPVAPQPAGGAVPTGEPVTADAPAADTRPADTPGVTAPLPRTRPTGPTQPVAPDKPALPPVRPPDARPAGPDKPVPGMTRPTVGGEPGKVLFTENFAPAKYHWNEDSARSISDGEIRIRAVGGYLLSGFPFPWTDYVYRAKTRSLSEGGGTYGVVTRLQKNGTSGYLFVIRDPDVFAVARLDEGRSVLLRRGQFPVPVGWKRLEVECQGNTFSFSVNGAVVASFSDDRYTSGGIGLWVDNHRQAAFADLVAEEARPLARVDTGGAETVPVTPAQDTGQVLLDERFAPPQLDWQLDSQRQIRDGALYLSSIGGRFAISGVPEKRTGDYTVSVELTRLSGPDRGLYGVIARLQPDSRSGYLFALTQPDRFVVLRLGDAGAIELARGTAPIRAEANMLAVAADGERLRFDLNGTTVAAVQDAMYHDGGFGLYTDNGVQASFRNLLAVAKRATP